MTDRKLTTKLDWEDVRYFLALARAGTLSGAARTLKVNHATVARRVTSFESSLGQPLFDRRADGYVLTRRGQAVLANAEEIERIALAMTDGLEPGVLSGVVRITSVASLAKAFLIDGLADFARRNPELALEFQTDTQVLSLARREADIALRLGRPKDSGLHGRRLADVHYAFYASPKIEAGLRKGAAPRLIGYDKEATGIAEAAWLTRRYAGTAIAMRANGIEAHVVAARAGYGVALLPRYVGDPDRRLRTVPIGPPMPPRELWLLSPRDLARTARVRAVLDAIAEVVAKQRCIIEGR